MKQHKLTNIARRAKPPSAVAELPVITVYNVIRHSETRPRAREDIVMHLKFAHWTSLHSKRNTQEIEIFVLYTVPQ